MSTPDDHGTLVVVMTQMRGDRVTLRKVISDSFLDRNAAMDEFMRLATRIFYFDEAQEFAR